MWGNTGCVLKNYKAKMSINSILKKIKSTKIILKKTKKIIFLKKLYGETL
jgi:hypothetical protein